MNRGKKKSKTTGADKLFHAINYTVFALISLIFAYPFYYIIINTISNNDLVDLGRVLFWPKGIHFSNYAQIFQIKGIGSAALISLMRTVLGTFLSVMGASYLGYLFSKQKMWHHKFWYRFVIITMYFTAGLIPVYLNIKMLGLINSFWVYVIPGMFPVYNMVLVKTYMENIPAALEESAAIDGAGYFRRYLFIMLPMSLPILATIAVFIAVGQWSAFMDTVLYINTSRLYTLQYRLYQYFHQVDAIVQQIENGMVNESQISNMITPTSVRLTATVVITLPIMFVYPFMQRYFMKGIMIGAIKG
jgi:multiple sugar transport system permease protein/putative aldouronate transport system permease protein